MFVILSLTGDLSSVNLRRERVALLPEHACVCVRYRNFQERVHDALLWIFS